jgi:steroid 5-alpha reductase family enzyme
MLGFWTEFFLIGFVIATVAYWIALRVRLMAVVDTIWTSGLGLGAMAYLYVHGFETVRSFVVCLVIMVWSFRLSYHLFCDRVLKGEEDPRYLNLAKHWGDASKRNFYFLFLAQILFVALFLVPVTLAMRSSSESFLLMDWLAICLAGIALTGEYLADRQLAEFRGNPANKGGVCKEGLWRYSRHPNYFFEWLHWWAYVAFAWSSALWWLSLIGPLAMYIFLRYLTGVPHAERSSLRSRGEAYREYQQTTNTFFPWIPRKHTL